MPQSRLVEVDGIDRTVRRLEVLKRKSKRKAQLAVQATLKKGQDVARGKAPGKTLPQSIQTRTIFSLGAVGGEVFTKHPAAWWMEHGTDPHTITPTKREWLRFETDEGEIVFAKKVEHPGTKPYKYMDAAQKVMGPFLASTIREAYRDLDL